MFKIRNLTLLLLAVISFNTVSSQAVKEGDILVDGYYGYPNLFKVVFKAAYLNSGEELDVQVGGIGPVGGRVEYLVSNEIGVGIDVGYRNTFVNYREGSQEYNNNTGQYEDVLYDYTFSTAKIGVMLTFNYHFEINEQLDAYAMIGAGYGGRSFDFSSTDPNFEPENFSGVIPISSRLCAGLRYFVTDNIGFNASIGFGHSGLLNGGISFKL